MVQPVVPDAAAITRAALLLRQGRLVAFPTETVYGLGAHALDPEAIAALYAAKGRPAYNPVIVHGPSAAALRPLAAEWPESAEKLARAFWPGPLTLVVPKAAAVPDAVTAGLPAVGLRVPSHPVALALLEAAAIPVAAPSANRFTELSPTSAAHVARTMGDRVAMILDGGPSSVGIESTVVDCTRARPRVLRPGTLSLPELEAVAGPFDVARVSMTLDAPRLAPGMLDKHYAPRARVLVAEAAAPESARQQAAALRAEGRTVGLVTTGTLVVPADVALSIPPDPRLWAQRLYAALHDMDDEGCALVVVEAPPPDAAWDGVRDRLLRASAG